MPELPDVQGLKQCIDATSLRQVVCDVSVQDRRIVKDVTVLTLREHLENPKLQSTARVPICVTLQQRKSCTALSYDGKSPLSQLPPGRTRAHAVCPHFANGSQLSRINVRRSGKASFCKDREPSIQEHHL